MATVTPINFKREGSPLDFASEMHCARISGNLKAAGTLPAAALVYINSDGEVALSDGTIVHGIIMRDAVAGEEVTIFQEGVRLRYGTGMTPGAVLYANATGGLDTAPQANDALGVAFAISATDIQLRRVKLAADPDLGGGEA